MTIKNYLINLKQKYTPNGILDIGAHYGEFSKFCHSLWKSSNILMIEGNENCEPVLEKLPFDHCIVLLSDKNKEVTLYLNPKNSTCTGTSYYKEKTRHYNNSIEIKTETYTLDEVINDVGKKYDIIKLDTQGSELDIIKGGLSTVENASYIIMEVPVVEYNEGSPLFDEVIEYMRSINFSSYEVVDKHIWLDEDEGSFVYGNIFQIDVVFTK